MPVKYLFVLLIAVGQLEAAPLVSEETVSKRLALATRGNAVRKDVLVRLFREAGCRDLVEQKVRLSDLPNVICTLKGSESGVVIVGAHYDMTGPGIGVADNWGSTSLLPSILESFAKEPRRSTLVLIGFSDEERGLIGAEHYVRMLSAKDRAAIRAVINMDGVGMASTRIWDTKSSNALIKRLRRVAADMSLEIRDHSLDGSGIMDGFVFHEKAIPTLNLHGLASGNYHIPHSRFDQLSAVRVGDLYDTYRLVVRFIETLDRE